MVFLSSEQLTELYRRHADWYPAIRPISGKPQYIQSLTNIADQFDLILLDSFGVLCRGSMIIDSAPIAIQQLRTENIPFCVVSNDTLTHRSNAADKYDAKGFDFVNTEVLTSLDITEQYLETIIDRSKIAVIAPLEHPSNDLLEGTVRLNDCFGELPEQVDTVIFLTGSGWTDELQAGLVKSGQGRQFTLVVGNPDVGAPYNDEILATPGYFLADFVEKTNQQATPILFGKPDGSIFKFAMQEHGISDPSKVLMVGDTLHTDILGGQAAGCRTLLVLSGVYQNQDIEAMITETGIQPDFIAPSI